MQQRVRHVDASRPTADGSHTEKNVARRGGGDRLAGGARRTASAPRARQVREQRRGVSKLNAR